MNTKLYLVLENGKTFSGTSIGADKEAIGELVFTTSMAGYNDILTDYAYYGQIVVQTFPISGSYGVVSDEFAGNETHLSAYIVKDICNTPSNFRSEGSLEDYMKEKGIIGLCGIDTRELTRLLRENGTMNAKITSDISDIESIINELKIHKVSNPVEKVVSKSVEKLKSDDVKYHVALWNFGAKQALKNQLLSRGYEITVLPYDTNAEEIIKLNPDGVIISDGPGDPNDNSAAIAEIKKVADSKIPIFGISLGHQLLALSQGFKTIKLKYGHHGSNQPTKHISNGRVYITAQNHSFAVDKNSVSNNAVNSFINVNDGSCEGLEYTEIPAFSVQFHPECCCGPNDTSFLFDKFENTMKGDNK